MLFNKISTLILLALTASAAPAKRQSGEGVPEPWEIGVTIIPGQGAGDNPLSSYTPGGDCGNETYVCHELCHVHQQQTVDRIQCEDECYREISIRCLHLEEEAAKDGEQFGTGAENPAPGATGASR